jgi:hypothetical protein
MTTIAPTMDTFTVTEEIQVHASLEDTFDSIITQIGRQNETPDGKPLPTPSTTVIPITSIRSGCIGSPLSRV